MGDVDQAISVLRNGAPVPEAGLPALAGMLTALNHLEVGPNPPGGWLHAVMSASDVARCLTGRTGTPTLDTDKAAGLLRDGTPVPPESSPVVAKLLDHWRGLKPQDATPVNWGAELDESAGALVHAVVSA